MLIALLLAITTARGSEAQKFAKQVPMPLACYASDGKVLMRKVKVKTGPNAGTYRNVRNCVVDHIIPLRCGGPDAISNMQWQTYAASLAKDKTEKLCK